jgi:hypothetical protein
MAWVTWAVVLFEGVRPWGRRSELDVDGLRQLLLRRRQLGHKEAGPGFSPTRYLDTYTHRGRRKDSALYEVHVTAPGVYRSNAGIEALSMLVLDIDHHRPDWPHLIDFGYLCIGYTTFSNTYADPHWRLVFPLAQEVAAEEWPRFFRSAVQHLDPRADTSCGDLSRFYFTHAVDTRQDDPLLPETLEVGSRLLDAAGVPLLDQPDQGVSVALIGERKREPTAHERFRAQRLLASTAQRLAEHTAGGRQVNAYGRAHALGHWVAAGALDAEDVQTALWAACEANGVALERPDETRRALERGLAKGELMAIDFDADAEPRPILLDHMPQPRSYDLGALERPATYDIAEFGRPESYDITTLVESNG